MRKKWIQEFSDTQHNTIHAVEGDSSSLLSGKRRFTSRDHEFTVTSCAISPNGTFALTGSEDLSIRIWEINTGNVLLILEGHKERIKSVEFSPCGNYVLSGSVDGTAKIWDLSTAEEMFSLEGHEFTVESAAFSHDGKKIITGSWDGKARLWNAIEGIELFVLTGHKDEIWSVAFSPDDQYCYTGSLDGTIKKWNNNSGDLVSDFNIRLKVCSVRISPDGLYILVATENRTIYILDASDGSVKKSYSLYDVTAREARFCPNSDYFISCGKKDDDTDDIDDTTSKNHAINIWETDTYQIIYSIKHSHEVFSAAISPDGKIIVFGDAMGRTVFRVLPNHIAEKIRTKEFDRAPFSIENKINTKSYDKFHIEITPPKKHVANIWNKPRFSIIDLIAATLVVLFLFCLFLPVKIHHVNKIEKIPKHAIEDNFASSPVLTFTAGETNHIPEPSENLENPVQKQEDDPKQPLSPEIPHRTEQDGIKTEDNHNEKDKTAGVESEIKKQDESVIKEPARIIPDPIPSTANDDKKPSLLSPASQLFDSVSKEDLEGFIAFSAEKSEIDIATIKNNDGLTLLHLAAQKNTGTGILSYLIYNIGMDVNAKITDEIMEYDEIDRRLWTPLHFAAEYNSNSDIMTYLINQGANVNAKDAYDNTPLHLVCRNNPNISAVSLLMRNGATQTKNINGLYPNDYSSDRKTSHILREVGKEIDFEPEKQKNQVKNDVENLKPNIDAMFTAVKDKDVKMLRHLAENIDLSTIMDDQGSGLLHIAVVFDSNIEVLDFLLSKGLDIDAKNPSSKRTALHYAVLYNQTTDNLQYLVNKGANTKTKDIYEKMPVQLAVGSGDLSKQKRNILTRQQTSNTKNEESEKRPTKTFRSFGGGNLYNRGMQ